MWLSAWIGLISPCFHRGFAQFTRRVLNAPGCKSPLRIGLFVHVVIPGAKPFATQERHGILSKN